MGVPSARRIRTTVALNATVAALLAVAAVTPAMYADSRRPLEPVQTGTVELQPGRVDPGGDGSPEECARISAEQEQQLRDIGWSIEHDNLTQLVVFTMPTGPICPGATG
jgi:hypothetical protein